LIYENFTYNNTDFNFLAFYSRSIKLSNARLAKYNARHNPQTSGKTSKLKIQD